MCGSQQETRWSRDKLEAKLIPQGPTMWTSHLGQVRRNRSHLKPIPREQEKEEEDDDDGNTEEIQDNSSEPKTIKTGKEPNTIRSPIMTKDSNWN